MKIREILATTAAKTIEIEIETMKGSVRASVPIGTSRGRHEVAYLPVEDVVHKFALLRRNFYGKDFENQQDVDDFLRLMDRVPDFSKIGGNFVLGVSAAFLKAFALFEDMELFEFLAAHRRGKRRRKPSVPKPLCNVVGGWGKQSDIQEFLFLPSRQRTFLDSITRIAEAYKTTGDKLKAADRNFNYGRNIESGWLTKLNFERVLKILTSVGVEELLKLGLDMAASGLWNGNKYAYRTTREKLGKSAQLNFVTELLKKYPIAYIEDPFHEDDFTSFSLLTHRVKDKDVLVCGDDLFATSLQRLKLGISENSTNAVIIKPSQVGTMTGVIDIVNEAQRNNLAVVVSHRSAETDDILISHLAAGLGADYIKIGIAGERTVKINEILRIEEKITGI